MSLNKYDFSEYVVISYDYNTDVINVKYIGRNYKNTLLKLMDAYEQFIKNDDYIVREIEKHNVLIYKRNKGYLWDSKSLYKSFKIIGYNSDKKREKHKTIEKCTIPIASEMEIDSL